MTKHKQDLKPMITLFKAHQSLVKYIKKDIANTELDLNEFAVLEVVYHYDKITINEINDKVLLAASSLSYILNKLINKELIKKERSTEDKRVYYISLTNKGKEISNKIFNDHYEKLKELFSVLSEEEKENLSFLLKKIGKHTEKEIKEE